MKNLADLADMCPTMLITRVAHISTFLASSRFRNFFIDPDKGKERLTFFLVVILPCNLKLVHMFLQGGETTKY